MLPALERCGGILSRLGGIAKYEAPNYSAGFSSQQIDLIMDTLSGLTLITNKVLCYVIDEIDQFAAFSSWLRNEIDRLASSSPANDDDIEKESSIDHSKVLLYMQTSMTQSPLAAFFHDTPTNGNPTFDQSILMLDLIDKELRKSEFGISPESSILRIDTVVKRFDQQVTIVFKGIAEAEKKKVRFGESIKICGPDYPVARGMIVCNEVGSYRLS